MNEFTTTRYEYLVGLGTSQTEVNHVELVESDAGDADQVQNLISRAREDVRRGAPDGVGVFRARQGLALFFSPVATDAIRLSSALALEDCPRPDPMDVEVVVGPSDEPAWYDLPAEDIVDELDLMQADDLGMLGPDTEIDELLAEMRLARG